MPPPPTGAHGLRGVPSRQLMPPPPTGAHARRDRATGMNTAVGKASARSRSPPTMVRSSDRYEDRRGKGRHYRVRGQRGRMAGLIEWPARPTGTPGSPSDPHGRGRYIGIVAQRTGGAPCNGTKGRYWLETLGCPKNKVDSEKLEGTMRAAGLSPARSPAHADLLVVNTCAFVEEAREESIDAILELASARRRGSRLVVTGCLAERYGDQLAAALPEVDVVAGFGAPVHFLDGPRRPVPAFDLLELPRPRARVPWAYVKVAEGCDRRCSFCAIPNFRGPQRSRHPEAVLAEVRALGPFVQEVVLVAQDLLSYGLDRSTRKRDGAFTATMQAVFDQPEPCSTLDAPRSAPLVEKRTPLVEERTPRAKRGRPKPIVALVERVRRLVPWVRLLYLYPSSVDEDVVEAICATGVPYFDLSLQHPSERLLRRMRRPGSGERFLELIAAIRAAAPDATVRSSFVIGHPGETDADHELLLEFLEAAELDWAGFFPFSEEPGTPAAAMKDTVPRQLALERLRQATELQDRITMCRRDALVGNELLVLVERPGVARSHREAPEIDGIVQVPRQLRVGSFARVRVVAARGTDLKAIPVDANGEPLALGTRTTVDHDTASTRATTRPAESVAASARSRLKAELARAPDPLTDDRGTER
jgi:ribosomal protein S12 methylthiotransferase